MKEQNDIIFKVTNDIEGEHFIHMLKKFVNNDSYKIRVRTSGLDRKKVLKDKVNPRLYYSHVPKKYATHLRVYIDFKINGRFEKVSIRDKKYTETRLKDNYDNWNKLNQIRNILS